MAGIIDTRKAILDFIALGEQMETERSVEAITEIFETLNRADTLRCGAMKTEDYIALSVYYRVVATLMEEQAAQIISGAGKKEQTYYLCVKGLLEEYAKHFRMVRFTVEEEGADEHGG